MATKSIDWISSQCLPCAASLPANVKICISTSLIAQRACPITPQAAPEVTANTNFAWKTISAVIVAATRTPTGGGSCNYRYTLQYDDTQLTDGVFLNVSDISGIICTGCLTDLILESAGNDVWVELVPSSGQTPAKYRLHNQHGCTFDIPGAFISSDVVNALILGSDGGLFVPDGIVSEDADNLLTVGSDGGVFLFGALGTWVPAITAINSMTVSAPSIIHASWQDIGVYAFFDLHFSCTLGGSASNVIFATSPITPSSFDHAFTGQYGNGSNIFAAQAGLVTGPLIAIRRFDDNNFTLGASQTIQISGRIRRT